tara:strand:- start:3687 stop:4133 length:447 start_codon:yes stop_codon:yes gene_type:complete
MKKAYLIGHGNLDINKFIELLKGKGIEVLIDVRSVPYSKFASQFNKESLKESLSKNSIDYGHMGDILGGRHPQGFDKYMKTNEFNQGIMQLQESIKDYIVAIMCSEIDYTKCHRRFIGSRLGDEGIIIENISRNGKVEKISQKTLAGF